MVPIDRLSEYHLLSNRVILSLSKAQAPSVLRPTTRRHRGSVADICLLRQESPRWTLCDFVFVVRTLQIVSEADIWFVSLSFCWALYREIRGQPKRSLKCWWPGSKTLQSYCSFSSKMLKHIVQVLSIPTDPYQGLPTMSKSPTEGYHGAQSQVCLNDKALKKKLKATSKAWRMAHGEKNRKV